MIRHCDLPTTKSLSARPPLRHAGPLAPTLRSSTGASPGLGVMVFVRCHRTLPHHFLLASLDQSAKRCGTPVQEPVQEPDLILREGQAAFAARQRRQEPGGRCQPLRHASPSPTPASRPPLRSRRQRATSGLACGHRQVLDNGVPAHCEGMTLSISASPSTIPTAK